MFFLMSTPIPIGASSHKLSGNEKDIRDIGIEQTD